MPMGQLYSTLDNGVGIMIPRGQRCAITVHHSWGHVGAARPEVDRSIPLAGGSV